PLRRFSFRFSELKKVVVTSTRHCERGGAIQIQRLWIASSPRSSQCDQQLIRSVLTRAAARLSLLPVRFGLAADLCAPPRPRLARIMCPTAVFDAGTV